MLLRQALVQTRAGMPTPVLFNSRTVDCDPIDEVSAMVQNEVFDVRLHAVPNRGNRSFLRSWAGQVGQGQPPQPAAMRVTGAQAS